MGISENAVTAWERAASPQIAASIDKDVATLWDQMRASGFNHRGRFEMLALKLFQQKFRNVRNFFAPEGFTKVHFEHVTTFRQRLTRMMKKISDSKKNEKDNFLETDSTSCFCGAPCNTAFSPPGHWCLTTDNGLKLHVRSCIAGKLCVHIDNYLSHRKDRASFSEITKLCQTDYFYTVTRVTLLEEDRMEQTTIDTHFEQVGSFGLFPIFKSKGCPKYVFRNFDRAWTLGSVSDMILCMTGCLESSLDTLRLSLTPPVWESKSDVEAAPAPISQPLAEEVTKSLPPPETSTL